MIAYEYFFKEFYSRGRGDYLNAWATQVDWMAAKGWKVLDCRRQSRQPGFWTVVLERPEREFCRGEMGEAHPEDRKA